MTGRGGGYRYFGAAKALPGVRELFEKEPPKKVMPATRRRGLQAVRKAVQHCTAPASARMAMFILVGVLENAVRGPGLQ